MSQKLYDAVKSGQIKIGDLNDEGKAALRSYVSAKVASEGGGDIGFDPEVSDPSLQYRAANPVEVPQEPEVYSPEGGYIAPVGTKYIEPGDPSKIAFQALKVPYNLGFRGGPETDAFTEPTPAFTKEDMHEYQQSMTPQSELGKGLGFAAEQVGALPYYLAADVVAGAPIAAKTAQALGKTGQLFPRIAPAVAKASPYAETFTSGFGSGALIGGGEGYGETGSLQGAAKNALASGLTFGGMNMGMRALGGAGKAAFGKSKVEMPAVRELPFKPIETVLPKASVLDDITRMATGKQEVKPIGEDMLVKLRQELSEAVPLPRAKVEMPKPEGKGLTREGSISAAKFTILKKQSKLGEEYSRSFMTTGMKSPVTHPETKAGLLVDTYEGGPGAYKRQTHAMTEEGSKQFLADEGLERSVDYVLHSPEASAYKVGVGKEVIIELQNKGKIEKAVDVYESLAEQLTRGGQQSEAAKLFNALTPEGVGLKAAKDAKKAYDKLPEPKKARHKKATEGVQRSFDDINKETVDEIIEQIPKLKEAQPKTETQLDPAELLAQRVRQYTKKPNTEPMPKAENAVENEAILREVETLFKKAQEVLPPKTKLPRPEKPAELELVVEALQKNEAYRKAWDDAKNVLKEKYGTEPQIMKDVEAYIEHFINIPYSERSVERILNEAIKKDGFDVTKSAFKPLSPTFDETAPSVLIKDIIQQSGLKGEGAETLAMELGTKLEGKLLDARDKKTAQLAEQILNHTKDKTGTKEPDIIKEMFNTLLQKAKEFTPKGTSVKQSKDPMLSIYNALNNRETFNAVWAETKTNLLEKLLKKGISTEGANVDQLLATILFRPYSKAQLGAGVRKGIKDYDIDLNKIVREHYTTQQSTGETLAEKLTTRGWLNKEESALLAKDIENKFTELATKKKQQILDQMFGKRLIGKRKAIDDYMIELSNLGALSKEQYRRLVAEKLELPVFTEDMAKQLMKLANDAQTLKGREGEIARGKIKEILSLLRPATTGQKVDSFRRIAMLLNPKTHIRNIGGNTILGVFENIKDIPGSLTDMGITAARKARGVEGVTRTTLMPSLTGVKEQGKGFVEGFKRVASDVKHGVDTTPKGQYEIPSGKSFNSKIGKAFEGTTNTLLKGGDVPYYQAAYRDTLRQQMKIHKVDTPTEAMKDFARNVAEHRTFQNDSAIASGVKYLQGGLNKIGSAVGLGTEEWGAGNVVFPFVKTLGNIMDKAVEYSPVGVIRAGRLAYQGNKMGNFDQKAFVDAVGRTVTGSAAILLGYDLCKAGVITGQQDKDADVASFKRTTGENPYSFNMSAAIRLVTGKDPAPQKGDVIRTYDFAQPISVALAVGADIYNGVKNRKAASNMVIEAIKSGGNTLMKQSVMQGLQKMMGGYDAMQGIMDTILQTPLQFAPTLGGQIAKATDPTARETYSTTDTGEIGNKLKAKFPVLSKTLPAKYDTLGRPVDSVQGGNTIFNTFFNPSTTREYNPTDVEQKIMSVYKATGDKTVFPRSVKDYKSFPVSGLGENITLTPQEYSQFQKRIGEITNEKFATVKTDDAAAAAKEMNKIMDAAVVTVKMEILGARGLNVVKKGTGLTIK